MTDKTHQQMLLLANTIQGELNRICVTDDYDELDMMFIYVIENITKLRAMRKSDIKLSRYKEETRVNHENI